MRILVASFPKQLIESAEIAAQFSLTKTYNFQNIVITGLGGSGIGGAIISDLLKASSKFPIHVNKGYNLPGFANQHTLVIACSYSGNTEETISVFDQAVSNNCQLIGITSGGELEKKCTSNNFEFVIIPGGLPPRAAFGYPFVQLNHILQLLDINTDFSINQIHEIGNWLLDNQETTSLEAKKMAVSMHGTIPVLYGEDRLDGVIQRFRQQINENAKMLCWHHVIPELNHNEIVGWRSKENRLSVLIIQDGDEFYRNQKRTEYLNEVVTQYAGNVFHLMANGKSALAKTLYLIHFADWLSVHLAEIKQIDPIEVKVIEALKVRLKDL